MLRRFLNSRPIDTLSVTQVLILQDGYRSRINFLQRTKSERDQRRFHDIQRREILRQGSPAYHF